MTIAAPRERLDDFISWVLGRAGLDAAAYRAQPLHRRLPACLRAMKVGSTHAARALLERKPRLVTSVISLLLIGVTEFFREPGVFEILRTQVLPEMARHNRRLRVWSAAASTGAELYSMAILLGEAGLLERSYLLGSDCRGDAIERARLGLYDATMLDLVPCTTRDKYFVPVAEDRGAGCNLQSHGYTGRLATCPQPVGQRWRPVEALRRQVHWKVADLLAGVEHGPWDIILWRNTAIYLEPCPAETIWRRLAAVLSPQGVLVAGKADRPPHDAGLTHAARCIYRHADCRERPPWRSMNETDALHTERHGGRSLQQSPMTVQDRLASEPFP